MGKATPQSTELRHRLHRAPEVSGEERETASLIAATLESLAPTRLETGLGGHGVAAVFGPDDESSSITLRAELDALPIEERTGAPHASRRPGVMHACGHDGHMACLIELARRLSADPPTRRVTLLFQPAEETGVGALGVIADPRWPGLRGRRAFAYHNDPGRPLGQIALREGVMACASVGLRIELLGDTAHTSLPERDRSPALVLARLLQRAPSIHAPGEPLRMTTVAHASAGEATFGVSPGSAVAHLSCRGQTTAIRDEEVSRVTALAHELAGDALRVSITHDNPFNATHNDPSGVAIVTSAARVAGLSCADLPAPQRWSEDFGRLIDDAPDAGALLLIGSGVSQPALHDPAFDFPDELIHIGADLYEAIARG